MQTSGNHTRVNTALAAIAAVAVVVGVAIGPTGCQEKFDLGTLPEPTSQIIHPAYVEIFPTMGTFVKPRGLYFGRDQMLYVADSGGNALYMMNLAGQVLSRRSMPHPVSIAQDTRLDLLVGAEIDQGGGSF